MQSLISYPSSLSISLNPPLTSDSSPIIQENLAPTSTIAASGQQTSSSDLSGDISNGSLQTGTPTMSKESYQASSPQLRNRFVKYGNKRESDGTLKSNV